jgi:hypothetical protein
MSEFIMNDFYTTMCAYLCHSSILKLMGDNETQKCHTDNHKNIKFKSYEYIYDFL